MSNRAPTAAEQFESLARALADMPVLTRRLLAEHPASDGPNQGHCPGCTTPGSRRTIGAPCSIRALAMLAQRLRSDRASGGARPVQGSSGRIGASGSRLSPT
jgi:hypothetical protein